MTGNEQYVILMMQAIETVIKEKGIQSQRHNIAETLAGLRKTCSECDSLITKSLSDIKKRNNLTLSWDELISTDN